MEGMGDKLTMLLPKSAPSIHGGLKEIRRETDEESPRGFDLKSTSRLYIVGVSIQPHTMRVSATIVPAVP